MNVRDDASRFTRRKLFTMGGVTVATAAVLTACKKKGPPPAIPLSGQPDSVEKPPTQVIDDIVLLRTASSLEHVVIDAYQFALDSGLLPSVSPTAKTFQDHHRKHATRFEDATTAAGGEPFTKRNDVVWNAIVQPKIVKDAKGVVAVADEQSALEFFYGLEAVAAATYQAMVPMLSKPALRREIMTAGGVDSRHGAVLASFIERALIAPGVTASVAATTTTAAPGGTTRTTVAATQQAPIYRIPGAFGPLTSALGPNSFEYYAKPATTATT